ncbi:MAG TPA: FG-GAP-like repeat-containing protein [Verrucomicrobiales bacterium]|nr:FG-GAP-like repeat-containing protein [Verrucomicrobiales bacterium]
MKLCHIISAVFAAMLPVIPAWSANDVQTSPLAAGAPREGAPLFLRIPPEASGVTHANPIDITHPLKRVYHSSSASGGVAIGDFDLDGEVDFFAACGPLENVLYLNRGDFKFEEVGASAGIGGGGPLVWGIGAAAIDIDNDGDLDIYVCNYNYPNQLFINQSIVDGKRQEGPLRFIEKAKELGLAIVDASVMPTFADYDRDGDLDCYILTHQLYREKGRPIEPIRIMEKNGKFVVDEPYQPYYEVDDERDEQGGFLYSEVGRPDYFLRNDGAKGFTDVTTASGIGSSNEWGNSCTWWDYNNDGWPDLYVGNDFASPDRLYRNNGDGTFSEIARGTIRHSTWFTMGAAQSDFNNDGFTDFILADMLPTSHYMQKASMGAMGSRFKRLAKVGGPMQLMRNALYINTGTDRMMEGAWLAGVAMTEWTWGIRSADFDNDTLADIFFTNGIPRQFNHSDLPPLDHAHLVGRTAWDHYEGTPERREQNKAYRNLGNFQFEDVSHAWALDHVSMSYGASLADFDHDGRLDMIVTNLEDPLSLYRNQGATGNRLVVELAGRTSNRQGIGSRLVAELPDGTHLTRHFFPNGGYLDSDQAMVHFGLGNAEQVTTLTVDWPSGHHQVFRDLAINQRIRITEPEGSGSLPPAIRHQQGDKPTVFRESLVLKGFSHREADFDDYLREPLLPHRLSRLGPGQAWADVDGDGDSDLFLGGAAGQPGQYFQNATAPGSKEVVLYPVPVPDFLADAKYEDMGAVWFDADSDGDLDLYVASGSSEWEPGAPELRDRLYLNDGRGELSRAPEGALPDIREASSVVSAADIDHDGDLDLFVGSRSVPGQYPAVPRSVLLRNDKGVFHDVTNQVAPALERTGLVTSALWTDIDGDSWSDLLVTHDWGPIKCFRNVGGAALADATENAGLTNQTGWWNSLAAGDLDGDGDLDYVAGNFGQNTQYHASPEKPELIFYGDMDGSGKSQIIEANFEPVSDNGNEKMVCFPRRGFSCSSRAMPFLVDKVKTYHNFAKSALTDLYDVKRLEHSLMHKATTLESCVLLNEGEGRFTIRPLPHLAQVSPAFGIALRDVDLDGKLDCLIANNYFSPQIEVGPHDTGLGLMLRGTGKAEEPFTVVWPRESGMEAPNDSKSLGVTDLNLDGKPDFLISVNNGDPQIFLNQHDFQGTRPLRIRLLGIPGNTRSVGTRVVVSASGMPAKVAEISAGGGYLSQSDSDILMALPDTLQGKMKVMIRWPEGGVSEVEVDSSMPYLEINRNPTP